MQQPDRRERADGELREHRHDDERPVRLGGREADEIDRTRVRREILGQRDPRRRDALVRGRHARRRDRDGGRGAPLVDLDDLDLNRARRAGGHARGRLPETEAAVAHVALADHAALRVVLRHAVRAVPRAVLAADAGVGAVQHDAGRWDLSCRRPPGQPLMHVGSTQWLHPIERYERCGLRIPAAFDLADAPPVDRRRIAVLLVARDDAALAADALAHVEVKPVLLARFGRAKRHARGQRREHGARRAPQTRERAGVSTNQQDALLSFGLM